MIEKEPSGGNSVSEDIEEGEIGLTIETIKDIDEISEALIKEGLAQLDKLPPEKRDKAEAELKSLYERVRETAAKFKEAILVYTRLVVLGGLVFVSSGERPTEHKSLEWRIQQAKIELERDGITTEQRRAYIPGVNNLLQRGVFPQGYDHGGREIIGYMVKGRGKADTTQGGLKIGERREDAWRIYLGIPQKEQTFGISDYLPEGEKDKYYYKINNFFKLTFAEYSIHASIEGIIRVVASGGKFYSQDYVGGIMGQFHWGIGQDENGHFIYYYDKWNLDIPIERDGLFGKPFEIYDRLYYDPETFEPIGLDSHLTQPLS